MTKIRFFKCKSCGSILRVVDDLGYTAECCNSTMVELKANTEDAATEKHVPFCTRDGQNLNVVVGSVVHPMVENHSIRFITAVCNNKVQTVHLNPGEEPKADFIVDKDAPVDVYEYCNLHGLWLTKVK